MVPTGVVLALTVVAANELADAIAGKASAARTTRPPQAAARAGRRRRDGRAAGPGRPGSAILEVRDLDRVRRRRSRRWSPASRSASSQGRVLGLVGESGCGKTMTARSLMGLLPRRRLGLRRLDPLAGPRAGRPVGEGAERASGAARSR